MAEGADLTEMIRRAYGQAWVKFNLIPGLTSDERKYGAGQLRYEIQILVASGERDVAKIADAALCIRREREQVARSKARINALEFTSANAGAEHLSIVR